MPFRPTPPYQPDWSRFTRSADPYDPSAAERSLAERPDWLDLAPAYVDSVRYALETIAGYLEWRADDDLVLVLVGDHQPAASITGPGARWDVPVHVVGPRALLEPLADAGFVFGLVPPDDAIGEMHDLALRLLRALESTRTPRDAVDRLAVDRQSRTPTQDADAGADGSR